MTSNSNMEAKCLNPWTTNDGIVLCANLEGYARKHNFHVALTGGLLYEAGSRKDCDIIVYKRGLYKGEKELPEIRREPFLDAIKHIIHDQREFTRVVKGTYQDKPVDLIFVNDLGEYDDFTGDSA